MDWRLDGKVAGITGACNVDGIGFAAAVALLKSGAKVAVFGRKEEEIRQAEKLLSAYGTVMAWPMDVCQPLEIRAGLDQMEQRLGPVSIWVNNAGIYPQGSWMELTAEQWEQTMDVNVKSVYVCCQEAFRRMRERGGAIVNLVSYAARIPSAGCGVYAASKAAVMSMTQTMAAELAPYQIRVNGIIPGLIETKMTQSVVEERREALEHAIAMQRLGRPEEVGAAVAFLASDAASYMTGTFLEVSGGKFCVQNPDSAWKSDST